MVQKNDPNVDSESLDADNNPLEDEQQPTEQIAEDTSVADDSTDPLVDDIVSDEGDDLLRAQDAEVAKAFDGQPPSFKDRLKETVQNWWDNKPLRYGTLAGLATIVVVVGAVPPSRYFVLNTAGVRATASIAVLDQTTDQPLKNVSVALGSVAGKTGSNGVVHLTGLKLGAQQMVVRQLGFAAVSQKVVVGLGSNPLGNVELKAVGTQFTFNVTDYVSGKPVSTVEASSGDANAQADDKGKIILTVGSLSGPTLDVDLTADGYRPEKVTINVTDTQPTNVAMVTARKDVFISKQSGRYDLYKIDADGKNKQVLLAGTGLERPQIDLVPHPTDDEVALVSSRENKRDGDGYLLDSLTLVNVSNGSTLTLDSSERIQIIDWIKDRLVYVKTKAGASAGNPDRYQLMSYDYSKGTRLTLATSNYFNDIVSAKGVIYYAATNYYQNGQSYFGKVNPDSSGKQTLQQGTFYGITRADYDDLLFSGTAGDWYSYKLGDSSAHKLSQVPSNQYDGRFYLDSPDGKHSLWIDNRDGKGVLLAYDPTTKKDTVLISQSGLSYPIRWLDNSTIVFRVVTSGESANYVVSVDGGSAKKITDVTDTDGLGKWAYW